MHVFELVGLFLVVLALAALMSPADKAAARVQRRD